MPREILSSPAIPAPNWAAFAGQELAPAPVTEPVRLVRQAGCCGFFGPGPSATLDKMLTSLSIRSPLEKAD